MAVPLLDVARVKAKCEEKVVYSKPITQRSKYLSNKKLLGPNHIDNAPYRNPEFS